MIKVSNLWKWRDLFLGTNHRTRDIPRALTLAKKTDHPDARYIARIINDPRNVLQTLRQHVNDETAPKGLIICFIWYYDDDQIAFENLRTAARLGYPMAQSICDMSIEAAKSNDPNALFNVGKIEESASMGHVMALEKLYRRTKDIRMVYILAKRVNSIMYTQLIQRHLFETSQIDSNTYFLCKKLRKGKLDIRLLMSLPTHLARFDQFCQSVKDKVANWSRFAKRVGLCRDVRIYVGKLIWKCKFPLENHQHE